MGANVIRNTVRQENLIWREWRAEDVLEELRTQDPSNSEVELRKKVL
jgi:hypothetical protein